MNTDNMDSIEIKPLTRPQKKILVFVEKFLHRAGFPPTLREIGRAVGLTHINAVRGHLTALEKKGYITRTPDKARSIQVVHSPSALSQVKRKLHEVLRTDQNVFHRVLYGVAWCTRGRSGWLTGPRAELMKQALEREALEHGWKIHDQKIEPDHIVVVVETWPNHSPQRTVRRFQMTSKILKRRYPDEFSEEIVWGKGYVATTDLELLENLVDQFLKHQAQEG